MGVKVQELSGFVLFVIPAVLTAVRAQACQVGNDTCGHETECARGTCRCKPGAGGLRKTDTGVKYCREICNSGKCPRNTTCEIEDGSKFCYCLPGYARSNWGQCLGVNELEQPERCVNNTEFNNTCGKVTRHCPDGYKLIHGKATSGCADIDECTENQSICGNHSVCTNQAGSYTCACEEGHISASEGNRDCFKDTLELSIPLAAGLGGLFILILIPVILFLVRSQSADRSDGPYEEVGITAQFAAMRYGHKINETNATPKSMEPTDQKGERLATGKIHIYHTLYEFHGKSADNDPQNVPPGFTAGGGENRKHEDDYDVARNPRET